MGRGILQLAAQKERRCTPVFVAGAASGVAALAGTAAFVGAGAALFAAREARRVRDAPPAPLYSEDELLRAVHESELHDPSVPRIDCSNVQGAIGSSRWSEGTDPDLFVMCLRHILYESKPIFRHCAPEHSFMKRGSVVLRAVTAKLSILISTGAVNERAKLLCRLTPLLRLRGAPLFRRDLRLVLVRDLQSPLNDPTPNGGVVAASMAIVRYATSAIIQRRAPDDPNDRITLMRIWNLRAAHVVNRANNAHFDSRFNIDLSVQLGQLKVGSPELDIAARICGGLFYGAHGMSETSPSPSHARGLPDALSRIDEGLMSAVWSMAPEWLSMDRTKQEGWLRVRDLMLATAVTHHIGYEPEWWGWVFARVVADLKRNPGADAFPLRELLSELARPIVGTGYSPAKRAAGPQQRPESIKYSGAYFDVFEAAARGDADAFAMLLSVMRSENPPSELSDHVMRVLSNVAVGREYGVCASLHSSLVGRLPDRPEPITNTSPSSVWWGQGENEATEAYKQAIHTVIQTGRTDEIEALRALLDPSEDAMLPLPSALVGVAREFLDSSLPGMIRMGVSTGRAINATTMDLAPDRRVLQMLTQEDTRDLAFPSMLMRRIEELLFAAKQVDALEAQLFPEPEMELRVRRMRTSDYMSRLSYGVLVERTEGLQTGQLGPAGATTWDARVPRLIGNVWQIDGIPLTYEGGNVVKMGGREVRLGTPSHAQWVRGLEVSRALAANALDGAFPAAPAPPAATDVA